MVKGLPELLERLNRLGGLARKDSTARVSVGYSAPYAVYVHEDMEARHPVGRAKFLEGPARAMRAELRRLVQEALKRGAPLQDALTEAGAALLEASRRAVPVATGFLRDSGYVRDSRE